MQQLDIKKTITDIIERSVHDPFFWIAHGFVVASACYIVYNLWYLYDEKE